MRTIRLVLLLLVITVSVAGFGWLGYHLYSRYNRKSESPFNAIPGNTALIIQLNQAGNLLEELNRSNLLWRSMSRFPGINVVKNELQYFDSAGRKNPDINKIFQHYKIWVAITMSGRSRFGALYLASVGGADPEAGVLGFINELTGGKASIVSLPYSTTRLHRVQAGGKGDPFYFAVMKGVFTGSYHANLVKRSIDRLSLNTPLAASAGFRRVEATVGKKADANIFVNYRFFSLVLSGITRDETLPELIRFSGFADWSGLDLIIKKDELFFSGVTVASDSGQQFLSFYTDQEPVAMEITSVVPGDALYFTSFGWSDPARFSQRFQSRIPADENLTGQYGEVTEIIDRFGLNLGEYFLPWMGREGAVMAVPTGSMTEETALAAFAVTDTAMALQALLSLCDILEIKADSARLKGMKIYSMNLPPFLPYLFGETFGRVKTKYLAFLSGHILLSPTADGILQVRNSFVEQATIGHNKQFTDFAPNFPDTYNIFSFYNTRIAINSLKRLLNPDLTTQVNQVADSLRKFESVAFHFSSSDGLFLSNFCLRYNPNQENEGPLQWQALLDTTVAMPPRIMPVTANGNRLVLATDISGKLYAFSDSGATLWKKPVMGNLMGTIHAVKQAGNDSMMLLFNTDTHLYLLHADGRNADRYPMRFPMQATNGITPSGPVLDDDFRIFVAFSDNRLYRFNLRGVSDPDWNRPLLADGIHNPAEMIRSGAKVYLIITGQGGKTLISDDNGNPTLTTGPGSGITTGSQFYANRSGRKGVLLTTSPDGKLVFIQGNGKSAQVTLNIFSPGHRFFYADITGNGQPEYIFSDRNKIFYYNRNNKLIYSYGFRRDIRNAPFLLKAPDGKQMIGFVVPETHELFLFDRNGYRELEAGIRGDTPFDIGILAPGLPVSLVVGSGKLVKNYRLTKF